MTRLDLGRTLLPLLPCEFIKTDCLLPFQFFPNHGDCSASEADRERYDCWLRPIMTKFARSHVGCQMKHKQQTAQNQSTSKKLGQMNDDTVVRSAVGAAHNEQHSQRDGYRNSGYKPEGYEK